MATIGYIRSSLKKDIDLQQESLEHFGVDYIFKEDSGFYERSKALLNLKNGDTFIVFSLISLGFEIKELLKLYEEFKLKNINFISLKEEINTFKITEDYFLKSMMAYTELESDILKESILNGLELAKQKGKQLGRPSTNQQNMKLAIKMYQESLLTVKEIAEITHISVPNLYYHLNKEDIPRSRK